VSTEIIASADLPMTVASLRERAGHVQALIKDLMVEGVHYGVIPGTSERSLTKQGSELLLSAFHIAVEPEIEDKSDADAVRFTVKARGVHMGTGVAIGCGIGRCSSNEEKYKWRRAVCREEFDATPEARRRVKWGQDKAGRVYQVQQVRTNPEDLANTVLKMAKKRAQTDLCLTALAASDAFKRQPAPPKPTPPPGSAKDPARAAPGASNAATGPVDNSRPVDKSVDNSRQRAATSAQIGLLRQRLDRAGIAENYCLERYGLGDFRDLTAEQVQVALAWVDDLEQGPPGP